MKRTHDTAIRDVLQNPQLSKTAIRLYLLLALGDGQEIRYLAPEIVSATGASTASLWTAAQDLVKADLATKTSNGRIAPKNKVDKSISL